MIVNTPGVYIRETNNFAPSIVGVSTAIPVFVGFTEIVPTGDVLITSMLDFVSVFGIPYSTIYEVNLASSEIITADFNFYLYDSMELYFRNGGGPCYVISAGEFAASSSSYKVRLETAIAKIENIEDATIVVVPDLHMKSSGNNGLSLVDYGAVASEVLNVCGSEKDKFALFDYHSMASTPTEIRTRIAPSAGYLKYGAVYYPWLKNAARYKVSYDTLNFQPLTSKPVSAISDEIDDINADLQLFSATFTSGTSSSQLQSEYMRLVRLFDPLAQVPIQRGRLTDIVAFVVDLIFKLDGIENIPNSSAELTNRIADLKANVDFIAQVRLLYRLVGISKDTLLVNTGAANWNYPLDITWFNYSLGADTALNIEGDISILADWPVGSVPSRQQFLDDFNAGMYVDYQLIFRAVAGLVNSLDHRKQQLEQRLFSEDPNYIAIKAAIEKNRSEIPSQGAIAGIYCSNDRERGVWKSPANIAVQGIEKPMVEVSNSQQDDLNVDATSGKSINVIRTFTGKGPLVWGARTLDGNSNEWRYISVRRFFNYAEDSIAKSLHDFVFEPNNSLTWVKIKAMITSFLVNQWQSGALVGTKMNDAFFVKIGEETTTPADITNGIINIQIGLAVARPAEFIIIEFNHYLKA